MNRRGFLRLLGLGAVAAPVLAFSAPPKVHAGGLISSPPPSLPMDAGGFVVPRHLVPELEAFLSKSEPVISRTITVSLRARDEFTPKIRRLMRGGAVR